MINGWLVVFNSVDLDEDHVFDSETDFDLENKSTLSVYYDHGLDDRIGRRRVAVGTVTKKAEGLWIDTEPLATTPRKLWAALERMAADGELGFSSGAPGHLVEREVIGGVRRFRRWPLIDASYTPEPAEPRARAFLKARTRPRSREELRAHYVGHLRHANNTRLWLLGKLEA